MKLKIVIVVLRSRKMFLFAKIDKNVQINSLFLGIPKMFMCPREAGDFFI